MKVSNDENTAQVLNTFFSNIVGSFNIPEYVTNDPISDNISDPIIKLIAKYRKHPSILTNGEVKKHATFSFSKVAKEEIFWGISNLDVSKACQDCKACKNIHWKCWIYLYYLFGVSNRCRMECRAFFAWFPDGRVFYERAVSFS